METAYEDFMSLRHGKVIIQFWHIFLTWLCILVGIVNRWYNLFKNFFSCHLLNQLYKTLPTEMAWHFDTVQKYTCINNFWSNNYLVEILFFCLTWICIIWLDLSIFNIFSRFSEDNTLICACFVLLHDIPRHWILGFWNIVAGIDFLGLRKGTTK